MNHLQEINKTWFQHFKFALSLSIKLFKLSIISLAHSILPNIFVHDVSEEIKKLNDYLNNSE